MQSPRRGSSLPGAAFSAQRALLIGRLAQIDAADDLAHGQHALGVHGQLVHAHPQEGLGEGGVCAQLAADAHPDAVAVARVDGHLDGPEHSGVVRVEEGLQLCVLAVQSAGVLGQIVGADGEEVALLGQFVGDEDSGVLLEPDTVVSMNFWGFTPWLFEKLDAYFKDFLRALPDGELKKECLLPSLIGELIDRGELSVSVLRSSARWFGMTYHEDKEMVQRELQKLHDAGVYPKTLRA